MGDAGLSDGTVIDVELQGEKFTVVNDTVWERNFWSSSLRGWEDTTFRFIDRHVRPGTWYFDIGAWIGPMTLYAARKGARVVALEPDPAAYGSLSRNVALNELDADLIPAALSADDRGLPIYGGRRGLGASTTSALGVNKRGRTLAKSVTVEDLIARAEPGNVVVKVDIEGLEYSLGDQLETLWRSTGAPMHVSVHARQIYKKFRRDLKLFPRRKAFEATRDLLAHFAGHVRHEGGGEAIDAASLARQFGATYRNNGNFDVEISPPSGP